MIRSLLIIAAIWMLFSCKKKSTEPVPQPPVDNTVVNYYPKMTISTSSNTPGSTVHQFSYYPNNLVKTIVEYNLLYWPTSFDSTMFFYNANNQVVNKKKYANNTLIEDTQITYTSNQKIDRVTIQNNNYLFEYKYHYNTSNEVDYILTYQNGDTQAGDSVVVNGNLFSKYLFLSANNPADPSYFILDGTETHYASPNGIHEQIPTCLNLSIDFQTEVADCFLEMGETNFPNRNYFAIPSPRQYCSSVNARLFTYTFDANNRLTNIEEDLTNSVWPGPGLVPGNTNTVIYY